MSTKMQVGHTPLVQEDIWVLLPLDTLMLQLHLSSISSSLSPLIFCPSHANVII